MDNCNIVLNWFSSKSSMPRPKKHSIHLTENWLLPKSYYIISPPKINWKAGNCQSFRYELTYKHWLPFGADSKIFSI